MSVEFHESSGHLPLQEHKHQTILAQNKEGEWFLTTLQALGKTQSEFAREMQIKRASVSGVVRGKQRLPPEWIRYLHTGYGVSYDFLMDGAGPIFAGVPDSGSEAVTGGAFGAVPTRALLHELARRFAALEGCPDALGEQEGEEHYEARRPAEKTMSAVSWGCGAVQELSSARAEQADPELA